MFLDLTKAATSQWLLLEHGNFTSHTAPSITAPPPIAQSASPKLSLAAMVYPSPLLPGSFCDPAFLIFCRTFVFFFLFIALVPSIPHPSANSLSPELQQECSRVGVKF